MALSRQNIKIVQFIRKSHSIQEIFVDHIYISFGLKYSKKESKTIQLFRWKATERVIFTILYFIIKSPNIKPIKSLKALNSYSIYFL